MDAVGVNTVAAFTVKVPVPAVFPRTVLPKALRVFPAEIDRSALEVTGAVKTDVD